MKEKICRIHGELELKNITSQDRCRICVNEWAKNWKKANRERVNETRAKSKRQKPAQWDAFYARQYNSKKKRFGTEFLIRQEISRRRRISVDEYETKLKAQNELCAICDKSEIRKYKNGVMRLVLDHNHKTNKVRDFLCHSCNLMIGYSREDVTILQKGILYLQKHGGI